MAGYGALAALGLPRGRRRRGGKPSRQYLARRGELPLSHEQAAQLGLKPGEYKTPEQAALEKAQIARKTQEITRLPQPWEQPGAVQQRYLDFQKRLAQSRRLPRPTKSLADIEAEAAARARGGRIGAPPIPRKGAWWETPEGRKQYIAAQTQLAQATRRPLKPEWWELPDKEFAQYLERLKLKRSATQQPEDWERDPAAQEAILEWNRRAAKSKRIPQFHELDAESKAKVLGGITEKAAAQAAGARMGAPPKLTEGQKAQIHSAKREHDEAMKLYMEDPADPQARERFEKAQANFFQVTQAMSPMPETPGQGPVQVLTGPEAARMKANEDLNSPDPNVRREAGAWLQEKGYLPPGRVM